MKIFLFILSIIFILIFTFLIFFLFSKITVSVSAEKTKGQKLKLLLEFSCFGGLINKKTDLKSKEEKHKKKHNTQPAAENEKKEDEAKFFDKIKNYYNTFCAFKYAYRKNSNKVHKAVFAKKINLHINFGTGDAAHTGILTGAVWAGIYNVIAFISSVIRIAEPEINIIPDYNEKLCTIKAECIINTRVVNLINAVAGIGISYLIFKRKQKSKIKGGD